MPKDTLSITDNRTGVTYEIDIKNDTIRAMDLRQIKVKDEDFGMMSYDPAFKNTASCTSRITFIDGEKGILEYRGYPIAEIAEQSNFLECAYLILNGELPDKATGEKWEKEVLANMDVHESVRNIIQAFPHDAHPMGMLVSSLSALGTIYPDSRNVLDAEQRKKDIVRAIAKVTTLAAFAYRHRTGQPTVYPDPTLTYAENFVNMLFKTSDPNWKPSPVLAKALDVLFMLHADHEQNCSTNTMRGVGSSQADPFSSLAAATAALYGPLHGGANEKVLRMLREIEKPENIPGYMADVKEGKMRLMGFGHRVYKNYDPRAKILREMAPKVFEVTGRNPLLDIAVELEKIALEDEYFVKRKLYPNVDFYSGIIYQAMGFQPEDFTVLFAIGRTVGWLAQWNELVPDKEQAIARPRQVFLGERERGFVPMGKR
jgi:citrate synthase